MRVGHWIAWVCEQFQVEYWEKNNSLVVERSHFAIIRHILLCPILVWVFEVNLSSQTSLGGIKIWKRNPFSCPQLMQDIQANPLQLQLMQLYLVELSLCLATTLSPGVTEAQQCLPRSWGNSGLSVYICFFSVCHCHPAWGSTVPSLYLAALGGLSHTKVIISLPTWSFRSLFLCNTKATSSSGREKRHRNNAGVSYLLWGKIIQPIHTINHFRSWGWSQQFAGADKHIFSERRCYHLCQQRIFLSI